MNFIHALRTLRRSPAFTIAAVLSLALGLGASLAVFTVADNLLIRPLPYRDASRLVMLWEGGAKSAGDRGEVSPGDFLDWRAESGVFAGIAGLRELRSVAAANGRAEEFGRHSVTADFFLLLGVQPARGRVFTADEDRPGAAPVVLISYRLWQRWFGGDESILGRTLEVDSTPRTVVGVLPPGFHFLHRDIDLWQPLALNPAIDYRQQGRWMFCVGRLRDGVSIRQAQSVLTVLMTRLGQAHPATNTGVTAEVDSLRDSLFRDVKRSVLVLIGAVALMLAGACANVANLLLARYNTRRREIAMRASLGAGRWRVIRDLLAESLMLSALGGLAGVILARWVIAALLALAPESVRSVVLDTRMFLFAAGLALVTGVLFGIVPALAGSRVDLMTVLRGDSRAAIGSGSYLRSWLVGGEVAISVILLAGAMLLARSLVSLESLSPGLDPANLLTFRVTLPDAQYHDAAQRQQFFDRVLERAAQLPGVRSANAVSFPPFSGHGTGTFVNIEGRPPSKPGEQLLALVRSVYPGQFRTMGIPLLSGRDFTAAENRAEAPRRIIVNEAFVRQYLGGESALGKKVNLYLFDPEGVYSEIIGVAGNLREWSIEREPMPTVYHAYAHFARPSMTFLVRTDRNPAGYAEPVRKLLAQLDPAQPAGDIRTMEDLLGENYSLWRFNTWLLAGFALVAVALAAVGIYGVLAYSVAARTREIGVRTALGADSARIVAMVLRSGARPVAGGLAIGIAAALALAGVVKSLLFGVPPRDPFTFVIVPCVLAAVALFAALIPARRAARLDPMDALRAD